MKTLSVWLRRAAIPLASASGWLPGAIVKEWLTHAGQVQPEPFSPRKRLQGESRGEAPTSATGQRCRRSRGWGELARRSVGWRRRPLRPRLSAAAALAANAWSILDPACRGSSTAHDRTPSGEPLTPPRMPADHAHAYSASKGQPHISPGQSDQRERRPGSRVTHTPSPERAKQHWPAPRQHSVWGLEFRLSPAPEQPKGWTPTHQIKPQPRAALHGCCRFAVPGAGVWLPLSGRRMFLTGSSGELGARSGDSNPKGVASTPCLNP